MQLREAIRRLETIDYGFEETREMFEGTGAGIFVETAEYHVSQARTAMTPGYAAAELREAIRRLETAAKKLEAETKREGPQPDPHGYWQGSDRA